MSPTFLSIHQTQLDDVQSQLESVAPGLVSIYSVAVNLIHRIKESRAYIVEQSIAALGSLEQTSAKVRTACRFERGSFHLEGTRRAEKVSNVQIADYEAALSAIEASDEYLQACKQIDPLLHLRAELDALVESEKNEFETNLREYTAKKEAAKKEALEKIEKDFATA